MCGAAHLMRESGVRMAAKWVAKLIKKRHSQKS
jgi:hypothetical protein